MINTQMEIKLVEDYPARFLLSSIDEVSSYTGEVYLDEEDALGVLKRWHQAEKEKALREFAEEIKKSYKGNWPEDEFEVLCNDLDYILEDNLVRALGGKPE